MTFIDSHTHLDFDAFDKDRDAVISRAKKNGISDIIIASTHAAGWEKIRKIVSEQPICHAAYGLHPMFMDVYQTSQLKELQSMLKHASPVAIGEIGLDFFMPISEYEKQAQVDLFIEQLKIAAEFELPVIIHARKSLDIVLKYLRRFPTITGFIHSFSGSPQQAKQLIDRGFYLGFGGPISYTRANKLRKVVSEIPLDYLLLETDSPDQPDALHHGQRNEPAYLTEIAKEIAELRGILLSELAAASSNNARTLFKLSNQPS